MMPGTFKVGDVEIMPAVVPTPGATRDGHGDLWCDGCSCLVTSTAAGLADESTGRPHTCQHAAFYVDTWPLYA